MRAPALPGHPLLTCSAIRSLEARGLAATAEGTLMSQAADAVSDACHGDADASRLDPLLFCSHNDTHHQLLQLRSFAALIQHEPLLGRIGVRRATVSTSPHRNERRIAYNLSSAKNTPAVAA